MKNKKIIIIVLALLVCGLVAYFLINKQQINKNETQTSELIETAVSSWGNFTDESSQDYLDSVKPYYSEELYNQAVKDAEVLKRMSEKFGSGASSTFTITTTEVLNATANEVQYRITGERKKSDEPYTQVVDITFKKINGEWKITAIEDQEADE